jgi:hypothetical protein
MKVITPGHKYELENFELSGAPGQKIQFIQKEGEPLKTVNDGTTNEEVLAMLIDRCRFLANKLPSRETSIAITKMEEALMWFNKRTAERKARGVEGTHKA